MTAGGRLAITGGTGFVGRAVLDLLAGRGLVAGALARTPPGMSTDAVEWVHGDLGDQVSLARLVEGSGAVIHIAGLTHTPDPEEFEAANVAGTANIIAAAKAAGVRRLVFVSSLAARKPELSAYGASKARAEELVQASGLDWTIVRPPAVYGPHDRDMFELFRAAKWGFVPLPPGGATSIIHVHDLADLLIFLAHNVASTRKQTYEPDDGREGGWSHKELAAAIGKSVGRAVIAPHLPKPVLRGAAAIDRLLRGAQARLTPDRVGYMCHPNWVARSDRKPPESIWRPRILGEVGLAATAEWYRGAGWL